MQLISISRIKLMSYLLFQNIKSKGLIVKECLYSNYNDNLRKFKVLKQYFQLILEWKKTTD